MPAGPATALAEETGPDNPAGQAFEEAHLRNGRVELKHAGFAIRLQEFLPAGAGLLYLLE